MTDVAVSTPVIENVSVADNTTAAVVPVVTPTIEVPVIQNDTVAVNANASVI